MSPTGDFCDHNHELTRTENSLSNSTRPPLSLTEARDGPGHGPYADRVSEWEPPATWAEAAADADFEFFEVSTPAPTSRWAGGYGYGPSIAGPVALEILAVVKDSEVSVETSKRDGAAPQSVEHHFLMHRLTAAAIADAATDLTFPLTLRIDAQHRTIAIDGTPHLFHGFSLNDERWIGATDLDDGRQVIVHDSGAARPTSLTTCTNSAMTDHPPPARR